MYRREDPSFIQGLHWDTERHQLLESVGWTGSSRTQWLTIYEELGIIRPTLSVPMDEHVFGEGICWLNDHEFIEMTWMEDIIYILDRDTLIPNRQISMREYWPGVTAGWGITIDVDNNTLYVTDGTDQLTHIDATTLRQTR